MVGALLIGNGQSCVRLRLSNSDPPVEYAVVNEANRLFRLRDGSHVIAHCMHNALEIVAARMVCVLA